MKVNCDRCGQELDIAKTARTMREVFQLATFCPNCKTMFDGIDRLHEEGINPLGYE